MFSRIGNVAARSVRATSRRAFSTANASTAESSKFNRTAVIAAAAGISVMLVVGSGNAPVVTEPVPVPSEGELASLSGRVASLESNVAPLVAASLNRAFVFIKPHAANDKVDALVQDRFKGENVRIVQKGDLKHDVIDEKKLIDTHYGAIASKAVILKPTELNVPAKGQKQFEEMFGMSWEDALKQGLVYNAKDGSEKLGVDAEGLDQMWSKLERGTNLIKFGGGFYCGKVGDIFVMNGFYMSMRSKYCQAPAQIKYYLVEWNPAQLSWADFRAKLLGATDPTEAEKGSLRREIYEQWESLGLPAVPNTGDNGLHASASPFEAMAERVNWVGVTLEEDPFAKGMLALGIDKETIQKWMGDAQVNFKSEKHSVFDLLEDVDSAECLLKSVVINSEA